MDLLIVEDDDDLSRVYRISFTNAHFRNPTGHLGRNSRIVTLDLSAHLDNAVRDSGWERCLPNNQPKDRI